MSDISTDIAVAAARSHSLADLLSRSAARFPDKTALINGDTVFTYRELDDAVTATAAALRDRGMEKGDRLLLLARNSWQFAVLAFATARAGVILVPVNFMLTAGEVAFILEHCGATAVVADDGALLEVAIKTIDSAGLTPRLRGWIGPASASPPAGWEKIEVWAHEGGAGATRVRLADDDPIRIMYTSGTESRPKGVLLSSRALIAQYVSAIVDGGMSRDDIDLHTLPLYHCAQLDCFLGPDLYLGATSIILPAPDPGQVLRAIQAHRVTKYFAPPTVWISLLRSPEFGRYDLSSLRKGYYGASPMPVQVLREIQQRLPGLQLWNFYGQTELSPVATILPPEDQLEFAGSAGRPVLNVETLVVDEDDRPVPSGVVGEVVHRSPQATLGYWNDPDKTAQAFANGWFHSGDLGVFSEDGRISIVDRKKDMIKTGGENVASREVEEIIYLHPAVAEVAVFAIPDPKWVEAVVAAVVAKPGAVLTAADLRRHCAERLAGFKVPKQVFVTDSLPKNPSGKILKRDLRNKYAASARSPAVAPFQSSDTKDNRMTRKSIEVAGLHHGGAPIPQAALVGPLLTSSGINGMDPGTGEVPPGLEDQARLIFANIERILQAADGSTQDIAKCVFYVRDRTCRAAIEPHWTRMFPNPQSRPARHTLQHELAGPLLIQCELTAYIARNAS